MPLHFSADEYRARLQATLRAMSEAGLDGLLLFNQTSRYWLTGYDSFGFVLFECLVLNADGRMTLLTRPTDVPAARLTSVIEDIRVWRDGDADAATTALAALLAEQSYAGKRLGVEYHTFGLTARYGRMIDDALSSTYRLVDASELVARLRVVKSDEEIVYVREAARLTNAAFDEARAIAAPGAFEGDILAAAQGAIFRGGGDYPGNEFTIASADGALLPRYFSGRRRLSAKDQLMLQLGGAYRRYHTALMATICVGGATERHRFLHLVARECLDEARAQLAPGRYLRDIYSFYAQTAREAGLADMTLSACGYSLGGGYHPTWMDWPWIYPKSDVMIAPNMVFYVHMVFLDQVAGTAMAIGDTSLVTATGSERLTTPPLDLIEA